MTRPKPTSTETVYIPVYVVAFTSCRKLQLAELNGGRSRARTADLLLVRQAL
jgi:hypothetical protein